MEENTQKIEVNLELIQQLFQIAKLPVPEQIDDAELVNCIFKLKSATGGLSEKEEGELKEFIDDQKLKTNLILIIDDIGIVTYQLKIMLTKIGFKVSTAKDIFAGINMFVKFKFDYLIMDLFVSTEQEGFTLLNEVKKIITKNKLHTKIIVITASNKTENKVKCLNGGADYFVKKDTGWQDKIAEIIGEPNYSLL